MDKLLIFTTLLSYINFSDSIPVGQPATITVREGPNCGEILTNQIEQCLIPFEQKLVVYRAPNTEDYEKNRMRAAFCHEYEEMLQCLHTVLLQCPSPPALEHLNLIERRVGYLREFMDTTCRVPLEAMTPKPTTRKPTTYRTSTLSPTSLATLLKTSAMDPTTPRLILMPKRSSRTSTKSPEGSTIQPTIHPTRPKPYSPQKIKTTYNIKVVTDKLHKLSDPESTQRTTPATYEITPTPKIQIDLKDYDKNSNEIPDNKPTNNQVLPNIETSAIEDNIIRINNPINCDPKLGHATNPRCSMLQAQSSSVKNNSYGITLLTLLTFVLLSFR